MVQMMSQLATLLYIMLHHLVLQKWSNYYVVGAMKNVYYFCLYHEKNIIFLVAMTTCISFPWNLIKFFFEGSKIFLQNGNILNCFFCISFILKTNISSKVCNMVSKLPTFSRPGHCDFNASYIFWHNCSKIFLPLQKYKVICCFKNINS